MDPASLVLGFALGYLARGPLNAARVRAKVRREITSIADDLSSTANLSLDENEPTIQGIGGSMYRPFLQIDDSRYASVARYLRANGIQYSQGPEYMLVSRVITPLQAEVLCRIAMRSGLNCYRDDTDDYVIAPQGMMDIQSPIGVGAVGYVRRGPARDQEHHFTAEAEVARHHGGRYPGNRKGMMDIQSPIGVGALAMRSGRRRHGNATPDFDAFTRATIARNNRGPVPGQHRFTDEAEEDRHDGHQGRRPRRPRVDALAGLPDFYTAGNMGASGQTHWAGPLALTRIDVAARGRVPGRVDWFGLGG